MGLRTPLCDLLGIDLPILSAGMGFLAGPELAAAVSQAGGLGVLGNGSAGSDVVRHQLGRTRELTERPIGVNLIVQVDEPGDTDYLCDQIRLAVECGADHVVLFWGDPAPFVAAVRESGPGKVLLQVGSVREAEAAVEAGVDAVIAQGIEAGGHVRGTESVWDLLPATVDAVAPVPVLASGGVGDAEGVARALSLGAQGVSLGTRFVASEEADAHPAYKRRIVEATAEDTVYTELFDVGWPNAPHRVLRNRVFDDWETAGRPAPGARPGEGRPIGRLAVPGGERRDWIRYSVGSPLASFDGDIEDAPLWAGESVDNIAGLSPAGEIVRSLADGAAAILSPVG